VFLGAVVGAVVSALAWHLGGPGTILFFLVCPAEATQPPQLGAGSFRVSKAAGERIGYRPHIAEVLLCEGNSHTTAAMLWDLLYFYMYFNYCSAFSLPPRG
jgi:hypothetical protein